MDEEEIRSIVKDALKEELRSHSPDTDNPTDDNNSGGVDSKLNQLRREKAEVVDEMKEVRDEVLDFELEEENRDDFEELKERAEDLKSRAQELTAKIEVAEETRSQAETTIEERDIEVTENVPPRDSTEYRKAWRQWAVGGFDALSQKQAETIRHHREQRLERMDSGLRDDYEERRLTTQVLDAGGALVPEQMEDSLTTALDSTGSMRRAPTNEVSTETGQTMRIPQWDDTSNSGSIIKEDGTFSTSDPSTSEQKLDTFLYTSDEIEVTLTELRDVGIPDLESNIGSSLGKRIARAQNSHFTTGQGGNEPHGIVPESSEATTTSSAGSLSYGDFPDVEQNLSQVFFEEAFDLHFMFNRNTLGAIKDITDSDNNPIFYDPERNNIEGRKTVFGYPYVINTDMADIGSGGSGNKFLLFGAFERYWIRDVEGVMVNRIPLEAKLAADSRRAVGFVAFSEADAALNDPGDTPMVHLATS